MKNKTLLWRVDANIFLWLLFFSIFSCTDKPVSSYEKYIDSTITTYGPYQVIKLPITKGVNILNPIQLASGPDGKMFAANRAGEVYILEDADGDGIEDSAALYCNINDFGLRSPGGFTYREDTVYIGASQEIRAFLDKDKDGKADTSWTFFNDIPFSEHPYEWTCGLSFGPDGWLYFNLTTDSWNAGASPDPKRYRGSILRVSPDGKRAEVMATGIRSVYGMQFNTNGDLFFIDNEGGGNPSEELNLLFKSGFYGHNVKKYAGYDSIIKAAHVLETEVAPSQIVFNKSNNDFGSTAGNLFVAYYGPAERWNRGGVGRVNIEKSGNGTYKFSEFPVADIPKLSGIAFGRDGSLYLSSHGVADYWYNSIEKTSGGFYKVIYDPSMKDLPVKQRLVKKENPSPNSIENGRVLFADLACSACHATDGSTELLGPNLQGVGKRLPREDMLNEIQEPSKIIKSSMMALRVFKKNGQIFLGRMVSSDDKQISLMLIGNQVVQIPRSDIEKTENEMKSLMYENLLKGLSPEQVNNLMDYLVSLN